MRLPIKDENDVTTIDMEHLNKMVDTFLERDLHILIRLMCITWEKVR